MVNGNQAQPYYAAPDEFLQQGDIFRVAVVGPAADEKARIFRTPDGRHGSAVFEENCDARVFSQASLCQTLRSLVGRTDLHTEPFRLTPDGQGEMVVVYARLFRYFIITSHTCDISGKDHRALPWTTIVPVLTLAEICRNERLPFKSQDGPMTIEDFLSLTQDCAGLGQLDEMNYSAGVRQVVTKLMNAGLKGKILQDVQKVRNWLNQYHERGFLFSLPPNPQYKLPEGCVDFSAVFTVPTGKIEALKSYRIARVIEPFRGDFAKKFADRFARSTLPKPMKPDDL
jgi:hypothetical protein